MKTPAFWQTDNLFSTLLSPLATAYGAIDAYKKTHAPLPQKFPVPVICIGNAVAGGAGKTPVALAIGAWLKNKNIQAFFLSRGYGGALTGPALVNPNIHSAHEVGDEPIMLSRLLPTVIAKDRAAGAAFACASGAQAIVMDDGLQNSSVEKNLSLLVVDGKYGFGNGRLLPAGPLRESREMALSRVQAVVVIGKTALTFPASLPVIPATLAPTPAANVLRGRNVFAFCGIANPEKFFSTLTLLGANLTGMLAFSDHHPYTEQDFQTLIRRASHSGAMLVTTAKDAVRLTSEWKSLVTVVEVALHFEDPKQLEALLAPVLKTLC